MTIKQLKDLLALGVFRDEDRLVVVVSDGGMPATPSVEIRNISSGFDWDHGKAMIHCETPVVRKIPKAKKRGLK